MKSAHHLMLFCILLAGIIQRSSAQDIQTAATRTGKQELIIAVHARPAVRGVPTKLSIVVVGKSGKIEGNYRRSVILESSDAGAVPSSVSFSAQDDGIKVVESVVFNTVGNQSITGTATIDGQEITTTIPITVIPNFAEFPCGSVVGDVDGDGEVTDGDVIALGILNAVGTCSCPELLTGDLNRNGHIDDEDVQILSATVDAIIDGIIILPPPGSEPCIVEILQPGEGQYINRDDATLLFRLIGEPEPIPTDAVIPLPLIGIFANRPLEPTGRAKISAGVNLMETLADLLVVHPDGTFELQMRGMLPIGFNTVTVTCSSIDGHISCSKVTFIVTGVDVIHAPTSITLDLDSKNPGQGGVYLAAIEQEPDAANVSIAWTEFEDAPSKKKDAARFKPNDRKAAVLEPPASHDSGSFFTARVAFARLTGAALRVNADLALTPVLTQDSLPRLIGVNQDPLFATVPGDMTLAPAVFIPRDANGFLWRSRLHVAVEKVRPPEKVDKSLLKVRPGPNALLTFKAGSKGIWELEVHVTGGFVPRPGLEGTLQSISVERKYVFALVGDDTFNELTGQPVIFTRAVDDCLGAFIEQQRILDRIRAKAAADRTKEEELAVRISNLLAMDFNTLLNARESILNTHYRISTMTRPDNTSVNGFTPIAADIPNGRYEIQDVHLSPVGFTEERRCRIVLHELIHVALADDVNRTGGLPQDSDFDHLHDKFRDDDPNTPANDRIQVNELKTRGMEQDFLDLQSLLDRIGGR